VSRIISEVNSARRFKNWYYW